MREQKEKKMTGGGGKGDEEKKRGVYIDGRKRESTIQRKHDLNDKTSVVHYTVAQHSM